MQATEGIKRYYLPDTVPHHNRAVKGQEQVNRKKRDGVLCDCVETKVSSWCVSDSRLQSRGKRCCLTSETVKGLSLTLEGVDDVHGGDGLAAGVFGVGDRVANDVLEEDLEDSAGLFVDQTRETLDTTTTSQTADGGLGDTLDVIAKDLSVTLGASLAESLSSFSSSRHDCS